MSLKARIAAYDKAAADARSASAPPSLVSPDRLEGSALALDDDDDDPSSDSPESCASSSTASSSSSCASSSAPPADPTPCRPNEHLAVLIPRELWKPDKLASHCDKYACRVKFSLFERKHHCRKCGGVFCQQCSARATTLLDTTHLHFLLPPRGTPITAYAGPSAPIHTARVCDDCFEQLHGYPTPRPPTPTDTTQPVALAHSYSTLSTLSPATPPDARPLPLRSHSHSAHLPRPPKTTKLAGDLDRYPLKDPSATCKAAGGGRWAPAPIPPRRGWDARLPDGRLRVDAAADRRAAERRLRAANPVIVDGPIRVRKPPRAQRIGPALQPTY